MSLLVIASFLILGIQIIYLSLFLYAFNKIQEAAVGPAVPVSVIVCAHDEEANLRELVPLLLKQDHPAFEVIVVEDRGNDGTYDFLLQATKEDQRLKMVRVVHTPEHITGKKFALTLGIKAARYDWVLLTDADCRPNTEHWISQMAIHCTDQVQLVLGFSSYRRSQGLLNAFIRFETFLTGIQYVAFSKLGKPYMGVGRNLAYRKSLFLENKGFHRHQNLVGGDDDLFVNQHANRDNTATVIGEETIVFSTPKNSLRAFFSQKVRHLYAGKKYSFISRFLLGLYSVSWLLIWFFVLPVTLLSPWTRWIIGGLLVRWILLTTLFHLAPRKLGDRFESWKVPVLDFIYAFYYLTAGMVAAVSKKVKWRV